MIVGEYFLLDLTGKEPAVLLDEMGNRVQLLLNKSAVIRNYGNSDYGQSFVVVGGDFGNGCVKPAAQPLNQTFYNFPFVLDRAEAVQMNGNCEGTDHHFILQE